MDHALSRSGALDQYDLSRIGTNSIIALVAMLCGFGADALLQAAGLNWGHVGPAVTVSLYFAADILRRFQRGWDRKTDLGSATRNALVALATWAVVYEPELLRGKTWGPFAPLIAAYGQQIFDALRRWLVNNEPNYITPGLGQIPSNGGVFPLLPLPLIVLGLLCGDALAGPVKTIRVGARVGGVWTYIRLAGGIEEYTLDFGDAADPTPAPTPEPLPEPQPKPVPPPDPQPQPMPVPVPVDPTFPPSEYQIASEVYRLALKVSTPGRKAETAALAAGLEALKADCETGTLKTSAGFACAIAFQAATNKALGASLAAWKQDFGAGILPKITADYTAGKLNTARQWSVLLGEIIPALKEAAKR